MTLAVLGHVTVFSQTGGWQKQSWSFIFSIPTETNMNCNARESQRDMEAQRVTISHVPRSILAGESDSSREFRALRLLLLLQI